jgi:hypothetical protein
LILRSPVAQKRAVSKEVVWYTHGTELARPVNSAYARQKSDVFVVALGKSKFEPGPAPKSQTRTVVAEGDGAKYTFEGVAADGTPFSYSFTVKYDGKDYPITGTGMPGGADSIAIKRVETNKAQATEKKAGKEIGKAQAEVSKDGKVSTVKLKGKTADSKEYSSVAVYDKQ